MTGPTSPSNDLQSAVATAADYAGAHRTAPALLLETLAAVGKLADTTNAATDGGRRPFRVPVDWDEQLAQLAFVVYLLADQTGVSVEPAVRRVLEQLTSDAAVEHTRAAAQRTDSWI